MTDPKITTVQHIYEAFGRGDIGFILDQLTDDVDWASCPDSDIAVRAGCPVHVVGELVEDVADVAPAERLVDALHCLDLGIAHGVPP